MRSWLWSCLLLAGLCTGCQSLEMRLALVVPSGVDPERVSLERLDEGVEVYGRDQVDMVVVVPFGILDFEAAVMDAIEGRTDVVLVDVVAIRAYWWALVYGRGTLIVRGMMVPLPEPTS